jgi:hypothetical protein
MLLNPGQKSANGQIIPAEMDKVSAHGKKFHIEISMLKIGNGQKLPVRSIVCCPDRQFLSIRGMTYGYNLSIVWKINELRRPGFGRRFR